MYLGFVSRIFSSKGSPSTCLLKFSSDGSAFYSISMRGVLLKGSMLCISVFVCLLFLRQCDTWWFRLDNFSFDLLGLPYLLFGWQLNVIGLEKNLVFLCFSCGFDDNFN